MQMYDKKARYEKRGFVFVFFDLHKPRFIPNFAKSIACYN